MSHSLVTLIRKLVMVVVVCSLLHLFPFEVLSYTLSVRSQCLKRPKLSL